MHHGLDEATSKRYLKTIHSEAQRLTALVDDFLDVQKIEAGRFTLALESFELGELLEHEVELFSAQSANHTLEFAAVDEPLAMVGDRNRIGQVIANLLSNAIKYSPAGGAVTITATPREGFARVQVTDSGLGIPASQQAQVFTRFFRVDSSDTREIGGTGPRARAVPRDRDRARRPHRVREPRGRRAARSGSSCRAPGARAPPTTARACS